MAEKERKREAKAIRDAADPETQGKNSKSTANKARQYLQGVPMLEVSTVAADVRSVLCTMLCLYCLLNVC